jgi:hypothetical protein
MDAMTWLKLKLAVGVGVATLLVGGVIAVALPKTDRTDGLPPKEVVNVSKTDDLSPKGIAKKALEKYASLTSYSDTGKTVSVRNGKTNMISTFSTRLGRNNLFRIEWEQTSFPAIPTKAAVWSTGDGYFSVSGETSYTPPTRNKKKNMEAALAEASLSGRGAANAFFNLGTSLNVLAFGARVSIEQLNDEKIGGVDCYVIAGKVNHLTRTVWIGKGDFLLRQSQAIETPPNPMPVNNSVLDTELEREAKEILTQMHRETTPDAIAAKKKEIRQAMEETSRSTNVLTETHENVAVNEPFTKSDFIPPISASLKAQ